MPGIFGAYIKSANQDLQALCDRMAKRMDPDGQLRKNRYIEKQQHLILGRVHLGILNAVEQPVRNQAHCQIVFHGELYGETFGDSDPEFVLKRYGEMGNQCPQDLEGIFHFVIYNPIGRKIKIFSDKFGLQPLYYAILSDGIVFAGEVRAILAVPGVAKTPDYQSLADFFHSGQILGNKTLFQNIKLLPPGSVLEYDVDKGKASIETYFSLESLFLKKYEKADSVSIDDVLPVFNRAIERRANSHLESLGLSLSGGLDSRAILAGMKEKAEGLHTYTLGLSGCADEKLAGKMAGIAGTQHEFITLETDYISNFEAMADGMIRLSDGMYHPHESTEMLALEYFRRAPFKVLLRGHGGEIAKASLAYPIMVTPEIEAATTKEKILQFISNSTNLVLRDIDPIMLFQPEVRDVMMDGPWLSLEASTGIVADKLRPADVCIYHYINEHIRRQVVASLEIFRSVIEIRLPYLDEEFLKALLSLPVRSRWAGEVHRKYIQTCMPALMKVPDSNTGAPLYAGPLRLYIIDKFNSLMKKLSIKGFRHYTEFQKWHRQGFLESSRRIVFSERTSGRGLYQMDHLKSVFDTHASGDRDYGHILGTVVGLELWYRAFVD